MYRVKVNGKNAYEIEKEGKDFRIAEEVVKMDSINLSPSKKHILYKNRSYNVEVVSVSKEDNVTIVKVNGTLYEVQIEDQFDQLLKSLGMDNLSATKVKEVKAPMPGLVLKVAVAEGQEVKKGDNLLILEAMKMENILKSPGDGTIKKVMISQGDKVEKNQVLIQFG